ncbi:4Fe-4S dicluster domain-containing protein [Chloroflexota bacterium]
MKYAMIVDISRCCICYACQVACKDEFVGNPYPPYSFPQPDVEQEWIKVSEIEKGTYPHVKVYPVPLLCMQCGNAPCMDACPIPECIYRKGNGVILIDPEKCDGCKACVNACPYNIIFYNDDRNICQKCTLCIHRLEEGKEPACVDACPSSVFIFGEESMILEEVKKRGAKQMNSEYKLEPRTYYIGLPSPSLAGHVIDEQSLMDIPDAAVTISDIKTSDVISCKSDIAGNFLADSLSINAVYSIKMESKGFVTRTIGDLLLDMEYKHLGDIKLSREA